MRPDVKLGIAVSLVVVVVAGGYFLYRDNRETPVVLTEAKPATPSKAAQESRKRAAAPTKQAVARRQTQSNATPEKRIARKTSRRSPDVVSSDLRNATKEKVNMDRVGKTVAARQGKSDKAPSRLKGSSRQIGESAGTSVSSSSPATKTKLSKGAEPEAARAKRATRTPKRTTRRTSTDRASQPAGMHRTPKRTLQAADRRSVQSDEAPTTDSSNKMTQRGYRGQRSAAGAVESHRAQPGDSFASLARDYYGDEKFTQFLVDNNRHIPKPAQLQVGALVYLPAAASRPMTSDKRVAPRKSAAETSGATSARTYTVRSGDSFYAIARDVLGNATRWKELLDLNRALVGGDPRKLQVGQIISLP